MGNRRFGWHSGVAKCGGILITGKQVISFASGIRFMDLQYVSTCTSGHAYGVYMQLTKTVYSSGAPRVLTLWCVLNRATGYAAGGGNCVHANLYLGTGNTGVVGEAHAMASQAIFASDTRTCQGTWCAHKFVMEIGANNTMPPTTTFFLRFHDAGSVKTPLMFDFSGCTAGTNNCIVANSAALAAMEFAIRVKSTDGGIGYIPILSSLN